MMETFCDLLSLPWKLSIFLRITHIKVKTITISNFCTRNIVLIMSKLKTYVMSNYYNFTTNGRHKSLHDVNLKHPSSSRPYLKLWTLSAKKIF